MCVLSTWHLSHLSHLRRLGLVVLTLLQQRLVEVVGVERRVPAPRQRGDDGGVDAGGL